MEKIITLQNLIDLFGWKVYHFDGFMAGSLPVQIFCPVTNMHINLSSAEYDELESTKARVFLSDSDPSFLSREHWPMKLTNKQEQQITERLTRYQIQ